MPVYNASSTVRAAVENILRHREDNLECLVAFDASTDGTDLVLHRMAQADTRIVLVANEVHNKMPKIADLNLGMKHVRGAFVARMDLDDVAVPIGMALQLGADLG